MILLVVLPPDLLGDRAALVLRGQALLIQSERLFGLGDTAEDGALAGVDRKRATDLDIVQRLAGTHPVVGVRVQPFAVQGGHLRLADFLP